MDICICLSKFRIELIGTAVYGLRKYTRGAYLLSHLDHLETHVVSAILNIAQVSHFKYSTGQPSLIMHRSAIFDVAQVSHHE